MLGNLNITYYVELFDGLGIDDGCYVISLTYVLFLSHVLEISGATDMDQKLLFFFFTT